MPSDTKSWRSPKRVSPSVLSRKTLRMLLKDIYLLNPSIIANFFSQVNLKTRACFITVIPRDAFKALPWNTVDDRVGILMLLPEQWRKRIWSYMPEQQKIRRELKKRVSGSRDIIWAGPPLQGWSTTCEGCSRPYKIMDTVTMADCAQHSYHYKCRPHNNDCQIEYHSSRDKSLAEQQLEKARALEEQLENRIKALYTAAGLEYRY